MAGAVGEGCGKGECTRTNTMIQKGVERAGHAVKVEIGVDVSPSTTIVPAVPGCELDDVAI